MSSRKVTFRNNKNGRSLTNSTTTTAMNRSMHLKAYMQTEEYQNNLRRMEEQKKRESEKKHSKKNSKTNNKKHSKTNSKKHSKTNNAKKSANNATTKANNAKKVNNKK